MSEPDAPRWMKVMTIISSFLWLSTFGLIAVTWLEQKETQQQIQRAFIQAMDFTAPLMCLSLLIVLTAMLFMILTGAYRQ